MKPPTTHTHYSLPLLAAFASLWSPTLAEEPSSLSPEEKAELSKLNEERQHLNKTLWSSESQAQAFEKTFIVPFWNRLLESPVGKRIPLLANIPFESLFFPKKKSATQHRLGIQQVTIEGSPLPMSRDDWKALVKKYQDAGWAIEHTDWHQAAFTKNETFPSSEINFRIQAQNAIKSERVEINGTLTITWKGSDPAKGGAEPKNINIQNFTILKRAGGPVFKKALHLDDTVFKRTGYIIPATVVYDFNRDGRPEILQGSVGALFWNKGDFQFDVTPYTTNAETLLDAAVVEDFNGDGFPDMLGITSQKKFALFTGIQSEYGKSPFRKNVLITDPPGEGISSTCTLTTGDVDGDGDYDVWIGQWKSPYHVMPKRYYDANDGHASFLLINDGKGGFSDGTEAAGLGVRRHRRSYSGSIIDLDDDGDQDLLTVNDFAGVDAYHNDGKGHFTLVSDQILDEWHNFGMSHTVGDYNSDGRLDFYVQGMSSTTARRLDRMKAGPDDLKDLNQMRSVMGYGNRMYLAGADGRFAQPAFKDTVARTGWSWGSTSLDFDNDGHLDIFVANGHISGRSTQDHCTNFWCHEIYLPQQQKKKSSQKAIMSFLNDSLGTPEISWDGYQPNRLFLNQDGKAFLETSYLLGAGHVKDSRSAISADFDADGRQDLLFGYLDYKTDISHFQLLQNTVATPHHWIGVHLQGSSTGAKVTVTAGKRKFVARLLNGDSYQSQHPATSHFGLGNLTDVDTLEVSWPDGSSTHLKAPKIDQYHVVKKTDKK